MLNVFYILEVLRNNNVMQGLLPWWNKKDIEQQPNFFFSATDRNAKLKNCYLSYKRSGIITSCQDLYLGEPERM